MAHTFSKLLFHVIFSTKNRVSSISESLRERLYGYVRGVVEKSGGDVVAIGGTENHVHLLLELPASISLSDLMRLLKANTSKWVRETFPGVRHFRWQTGYGAFTVSPSNVGDVSQYIQNQIEHHRTRSFDREFVEFLTRHGIEYDPRFVLD